MTAELTWREKILIALDVLREPGCYLSTASPDDDGRSLTVPADAGLSELVSVRGMISEVATPQNVPDLLQHQFGRQLGLVGDPSRANVAAAREFSSRVAGATKKEEMAETLKTLLDSVDEMILTGSWTRDGEPVPGYSPRADIVFCNDFNQAPVPLFERSLASATSDGSWVMIAPVADLPEDHPLRDRLPVDDLFYHVTQAGQFPSLVLGLCKGLHTGQPRAFYLSSTVETFTRMLARIQHNRIISKTLAEVSEFEFNLIARRRSHDNAGLPPRRQPAPVYKAKAPPITGTWKERVNAVLEILRHPTRWLQPPPPSTFTDDLLSVRQAFEVDECQTEPNLDASFRLAARVSGDRRKDELVDCVVELIRLMDRRVRDLREKSILWSAQHLTENSNA
jgi:hypothetical protein